MSQKSKGVSLERELVHLFWAHQWVAVRVAGSGSMHYPSPDIIAGNGSRTIVIECKSARNDLIYVEKREIQELLEFAVLFQAEMWIGIRFNNAEWSFLKAGDLKETEKSFGVSRDFAEKHARSFSDLIEVKKGL